MEHPPWLQRKPAHDRLSLVKDVTRQRYWRRKRGEASTLEQITENETDCLGMHRFIEAFRGHGKVALIIRLSSNALHV